MRLGVNFFRDVVSAPSSLPAGPPISGPEGAEAPVSRAVFRADSLRGLLREVDAFARWPHDVQLVLRTARTSDPSQNFNNMHMKVLLKLVSSKLASNIKNVRFFLYFLKNPLYLHHFSNLFYFNELIYFYPI